MIVNSKKLRRSAELYVPVTELMQPLAQGICQSRGTLVLRLALAVAIGFSSNVGASFAVADSEEVGTIAANPIWTRSSLLDYPEGPKEFLSNRGISLDLSLTQFVQGAVAGEGEKAAQYGGKGRIGFGVDISRNLPIWDGLSLNVTQEFVYGEDANAQGDGSLFPVNTAIGLPRLGGFDEDSSVSLTQRFGDQVSLTLGKLNMLDAASRRPLEGGGGLDTFQNIGFAAPVSGITPPYILGASLGLATEPVAFSALIYDPRNAQDFDVIRRPFDEGVTLSLTGTVPTNLFGRRGGHSLRGAYSTQEGLDLSDIPQIGVPEEFEDEIEEDFSNTRGYWYVAYSFHQYFGELDAASGKGWGLFGEAAISDGNPNPLRGHWYLGLGGNSLIPGRSDDRWGIALGQYIFSDAFKSSAETTGLRIGTESMAEVYYDFAIAPWARLSANLQVIEPALNDSDTAIFLGMRAQLRF